MKWKNYQELAFQTNAKLGGDLDRAHMLLGVGTEIGELQDIFKKNIAYGKEIDWKNVKEEVGDIFWYIAGLMEHENLSVDMDSILSGDIPELNNTSDLTDNIVVSLGLSIIFSRLLSDVGRDDTAKNIDDLATSLLMFCNQNEFDVRRILENNIEKLRARFPKKFTQYDAINRDLVAESEVLDE